MGPSERSSFPSYPDIIPSPPMVTLTLKEKVLLTSDIWSFSFDAPRDFTWEGGQHTVAILEHPNPDNRGAARALSLASAPFEGWVRLVTHCPKKGSTFKQALRDLPVGGQLQATDPQDSFLHEGRPFPDVFVAGGIGCATIRSLLLDRDHLGETLRSRLLYYAPSGQHLFREELDRLAERQDGFSVKYLTADNLQEKGGIKEVESRPDATYCFSGVYARETLRSDTIADHSKKMEGEERIEIELLAKVAGLT